MDAIYDVLLVNIMLDTDPIWLKSFDTRESAQAYINAYDTYADEELYIREVSFHEVEEDELPF